MSHQSESPTGPIDHTLVATQHWAREGVHAVIVECAECSGRTFVGCGPNVPEAEEAAHRGHDDWLRAGAPPAAPQGVERLYRRFGLSSGRHERSDRSQPSRALDPPAGDLGNP